MKNDEGSELEGMVKALHGKQGTAFDQAFLGEMIAHHQGAVDMATIALKEASHPEVKQLAKAIISAQTGEITKMEGWQKDWGFRGNWY